MIECQLLGFLIAVLSGPVLDATTVPTLSSPTVSDVLRQMSSPQIMVLATNISVNLFHLSLATCQFVPLLTLKPLHLLNVVASLVD